MQFFFIPLYPFVSFTCFLFGLLSTLLSVPYPAFNAFNALVIVYVLRHAQGDDFGKNKLLFILTVVITYGKSLNSLVGISYALSE